MRWSRLLNALQWLDLRTPALFWISGIAMGVAGIVLFGYWDPPSPARGAIWFTSIGLFCIAAGGIAMLGFELDDLKKKVANMEQPREEQGVMVGDRKRQRASAGHAPAAQPDGMGEHSTVPGSSALGRATGGTTPAEPLLQLTGGFRKVNVPAASVRAPKEYAKTRRRLPSALKRLELATPGLLWVSGIGMAVAGTVQFAYWNSPSPAGGAIVFTFGGLLGMAWGGIVMLRFRLKDFQNRVANMEQFREGTA